MAFEISVLGCGEAFDDRLPNNSYLVRAGRVLLLDCGYSIPHRLWHIERDASAIDLIYISHGHADHYFGLPAVLGRMWEDGRTKALTIVSQHPLLQEIRDLMEAGYRGLAARFGFPLEFIAAKPGLKLEWGEMTFDFAPTRHSVSNLAVRIGRGERSICYSGDGAVTDEARRLYNGADLLIHEAYSFEQSPVHADIEDVIGTARRGQVKRVALTHIQRDLRRDLARVQEAAAREHEVEVTIPEPGDLLKA
ncbi:MAG TPA: ribonuclease Z [Bryobacteraceae bacterium]|nr:ribonuclease Z [Bryobacteraceae bacterium]